MRLSLRGFALVSALLWGGAVLCTGLAHLASPSYGTNFLDWLASIYPGFHGARTLADVVVGLAYALVDGGLGGLVFAWLYNLFTREPGSASRAGEAARSHDADP
jgi:hypothetical protein